VHINFEMTQGDGDHFWPHVPVTMYACARAQAYLSARRWLFSSISVCWTTERRLNWKIMSFIISFLVSVRPAHELLAMKCTRVFADSLCSRVLLATRTAGHGVHWTDPEGAFQHLSPTYFQFLITVLSFAIAACAFHASYRAWAASLFVRSLVRSTPTRLSAEAVSPHRRGDVGRQPRPWGDASEVSEANLKGEVKKEGL
jgi:hypothetical protein